MKCGTTSLYYYLDDHPEIGMSGRKETDFFVKELNYDKGLDWYTSCFPEESCKRGECSPNYTKMHRFPGVPERMYSALPDVKLVYMVRDPVERILSHYVENKSQGIESRTFEEAICGGCENHYILTSRYFQQIKPYIDRFGEDRILIRSLEELGEDPEKTLGDIQEFIGVSNQIDSCRVYDEVYNRSAEKRKRGWIYRCISGVLSREIKDTVRRYLPPSIIPGAPIERPELSARVRDSIKQRVRDDVEELRGLTGRPFREWCV